MPAKKGAISENILQRRSGPQESKKVDMVLLDEVAAERHIQTLVQEEVKAKTREERKEAEERQRRALQRQRITVEEEAARSAAHAAFLLGELHAQDLARNRGEYDWNQDT